MGGGAGGQQPTGGSAGGGAWTPDRMANAGTLPMGQPAGGGGGGKLAQLRASQGDAAANQALAQYYQGTLPSQQAAPSYGGGGRGMQAVPPGHSQAALDRAPDLSNFRAPSMGRVMNPNQASPWGNTGQPYRVPASPLYGGGGGRGMQQERTPLSGGPDLSNFRTPGMGRVMNPNPQQLGGNQNWEDILRRLGQGGSSSSVGGGRGNPWQGGLAQLRNQFTQGSGNEAITNPGSMAASQGAQTSSGDNRTGVGDRCPSLTHQRESAQPDQWPDDRLPRPGERQPRSAADSSTALQDG